MIWPDGTREGQKQHAYKHVKCLDYTLGICQSFRTAVQAGGNVGLWPIRMSYKFNRVITFEPEKECFACLAENVSNYPNVQAHNQALGSRREKCSIQKSSLGSHSVVDGNDVDIVALDDFKLDDVDLIQLDIEGFEYNVLLGAVNTILNSKPVIQIELRGFAEQFESSDEEIVAMLYSWGYKKIKELPGADVVFRHE